jgi:hypothetical protein
MSRHVPIAGAKDLNKINGWPYLGTHSRGDWQSDNAVDFIGNSKSKVYAVVNGRITSGGQNVSIRKTSAGGNIFGWNIYINEYVGGTDWHPPLAWPTNPKKTLHWEKSDQYWFYTHVMKPTVRYNQWVRKGDVIGIGIYENCLHVACKKGSPWKNLGINKHKVVNKQKQKKACPKGSCKP